MCRYFVGGGCWFQLRHLRCWGGGLKTTKQRHIDTNDTPNNPPKTQTTNEKSSSKVLLKVSFVVFSLI